MSKAEIASRLRQARLAANKTQKEVADALGMTYQAISNYERGKTNVESGVLIKLCRLYGVSVPEILGEEENVTAVTPELSASELQLIMDFRKLNSAGQQYILQTMTLALQAYSGKNNASSDMEEAQ